MSGHRDTSHKRPQADVRIVDRKLGPPMAELNSDDAFIPQIRMGLLRRYDRHDLDLEFKWTSDGRYAQHGFRKGNQGG